MAFDISSFGITESSLPNGWKTDRISSLADINPEQVGRTYPHSTIAYLDIGNVASGSIGQPETMPIRNAPSRAKRLVRSADIIISTVRPGNRAYALMREIPDNLVVSTGFAVLRAKDSVNPRFLYHLVTSKPLIEYLASIADEKSAYPSINPSDIAECFVPIPSLLEQNAIAHILGTLDEKIDLNRRINQTLEAMAQAIFKSWFVDFDPVKAKVAAIEQGQDPLRAAMRAISGKTDAELDQVPRKHHGQLAATAALFPDAMEESELGEIPKGWKVGALADLCHLNPESWSARILPDAVRYVDLANAKGGEVAEVQCLGGKDIPSRAKRVLRHGDTIVGTVRPGNRSFALIGENGLTGSTGFAVLRPKASYWIEFVYLAATSEANIERLAHLADGGAYPVVRPEVVVYESVVVPITPVAQAFNQHVQPLFAKILSNRKSAVSLAKLRNNLLLRLLSGELFIHSLQEAAHD